jgi:hypothetical protein
MLATTNDAFFAIQGVQAPERAKSTLGFVYDAGSEVNNESCEFIPGPPCENPFQRDPIGAEGYVYIHSGIHNIADLTSYEFDWHNPAVSVKISRMMDSVAVE